MHSSLLLIKFDSADLTKSYTHLQFRLGSRLVIIEPKGKEQEIDEVSEVVTELAAVVERYALDGAQYTRSTACKKPISTL